MNTPLIQEFFSYLNYEKHFSSHTLKCYATDLQQFVEFLDGTSAAGAGTQGYQNSDRSGTALPWRSVPKYWQLPPAPSESSS